MVTPYMTSFAPYLYGAKHFLRSQDYHLPHFLIIPTEIILAEFWQSWLQLNHCILLAFNIYFISKRHLNK